MVKKKTKTKKQLTLFGKQFGRSTLLIGAVILAIVGFAVYTAVANELDRRKFAQIEETVLELTDRINAEFNLTALETHNTCGNDQEKLGKGQLWCGTSAEIQIIDNNIDEIASYLGLQSDIISSVGPSFANYYLSLAQIPTATCRLLYQTGNNITLLKCSDSANAAYYPIIE